MARPIDADALTMVIDADINRCYELRIGAVGPLVHFKEQIAEQPTMDTKLEVYARWDTNEHGDSVCTACKFTTFGWAKWTFSYCPCCGAKMR